MPPDPVKSEDARAWLARAAADLRAARNELAADDPVLGDVVFHCQQAVEKAMKAFLTWHDVPFRKTHDLGVLGGQCAEIDGSLTDIMRRAAPMTEYAWKFRYPGEEFEPSREEVDGSLATARAAVMEITSRLPYEVIDQPGRPPAE
ncbi:MAG: HEPN domain-containing protein [Thermoleophilia bacterium]|jgi:HEPN domain-containing protein|nr:HEPN domain-containing protein [Thermoleophilia bacterium]